MRSPHPHADESQPPRQDQETSTTVAVKIKLKRIGKIRHPQYRIVVADARTKRDGRAIEEIGKYHPKEDPSFIEVQSERVQYWLGVGAQPTPAVTAILKVTGDWQSFKGEAAPEPMKVRAARADKRATFEAAVKAGDVDAPKPVLKPKSEAVAESPADEPAEVPPTVAEAVDAPAQTMDPEPAAPADSSAHSAAGTPADGSTEND
jgi:small subunit ribosomal protein S16